MVTYNEICSTEAESTAEVWYQYHPKNVSVIYEVANSATLNGPFQVDLGATFEIK